MTDIVLAAAEEVIDAGDVVPLAEKVFTEVAPQGSRPRRDQDSLILPPYRP